MAVELALFPLNAVLFPHMPMSLHVFEERYRRMLQDCEDAGTTFGVLAIREGLEVGARSVPYGVGTLAHIDRVERLSDGRSLIALHGASRFRVESFAHDRPYLRGAVTYLEDAPAAPDDAALLVGRVATAVREYAEALRGGTGDLPEDAETLSYVVAAALEVDIPRKQALLELDSAAERLRQCLVLLRREEALVQRLAAAAERRSAAALN